LYEASLHYVTAVLVATLCLAGCATAPVEGPGDPNDPFERTNRSLFESSLAIDRALTKPAALAYRRVPRPLRNSVRNFLNNLSSVNVFANDVLQAQPKRAGDTLVRAVVNTTIGVGGLFEVAADLGIPRHSEDFGQTLAVWGVGEGPYLVVPLLGPSTTRDLFGRVVDAFVIDPLNYVQWGDEYYVPYAKFAVDNLDLRERTIETLDDIERSSADFYAGVRSLYRLTRNNEIRNGEAETEKLPDF
jgi:phospholipid-binding lipoprotein MlaA